MESDESVPQFSTAEYEPQLNDTHAHFVRGLLFGLGGAALGLILYATIGIVTGLAIGYASLAVGWIVGKSILAGSRGRGGRRYQIVAILLTYAAVSLSAVPIALWQFAEPPAETAADATAATTTPAAATDATSTDDAPVSLAGLIAFLLVLGLASPLLELQDMPGGLIGLVILGVGMQIAWKLTAGSADKVRAALVGDGTVDDKPTSLNLSR